jgi:hypothetical protein
MMPVMANEYGLDDDDNHDHDERSISTKKEHIVTAVYLYLFLITNNPSRYSVTSSTVVAVVV